MPVLMNLLTRAITKALVKQAVMTVAVVATETIVREAMSKAHRQGR